MREAVIVSTARTPIGRAYRGAYNDTQAQALAGHVVAEVVQPPSLFGRRCTLLGFRNPGQRLVPRRGTRPEGEHVVHPYGVPATPLCFSGSTYTYRVVSITA